MSADNQKLHAAEINRTKKPARKAYDSPKLSVYGRIERNTGGGSGMAMEAFGMGLTKRP